MRRYGGDYDRSWRGPNRGQPRGSYYGYGSGGYYGENIYGRGRYGGDYLSAWGPGGWSREHGRDLHDARAPRERSRNPRYDHGYGRGMSPFRRTRYDDGAPTG